MLNPRRRKTVHVPSEVMEQLRVTAGIAAVPEAEVIRAALIYFARLDHGSKVGILGEFWYRGQYALETRGQMRRLRPVFSQEGGWCALVRARVARWLRRLAGVRGLETRTTPDHEKRAA